MSTSLIGSLSLEALVAARDAAVLAFEQSSALMQAARTQLDVFGVRWPLVEVERSSMLSVHLPYSQERTDRDRENLAEEIDRQCWSTLFEKTNVRQILSAKKREELDKMLNERTWDRKRTLLPFTVENIESTLAGLHEKRADLFEESVVELYRSLSWDHKTNSPFKLQSRLIVHTYQFEYSDRHALYDLERVLCLLDGQAVPDYSFGLRAMRHVPRAVWHTVPSEKRPLFQVKFFSGTIHAKILVPELIDQLNKIVAKHYPFVLGRKSA